MSTPTIPFDAVLSNTSTDKRIEVLRSIHQTGSISEAARANLMSYKAAWLAVDTLSTLAGVPLLEKAVGGSGGGGAQLTLAGTQVLQVADALQAARHKALQKILGLGKAERAALPAFTSLGLRTSMRNQLPCKVHDYKKNSGVMRVWLELADGQILCARITAESFQLLDLKKGMPVLALCKAAAVTLAPTIVTLGGVNILHGKVNKRLGSKADRQYQLALAPHLHLVGFADANNPLTNKQAAMAALEETAVVIALP